jgi:hypothetical protein
MKFLWGAPPTGGMEELSRRVTLVERQHAAGKAYRERKRRATEPGGAKQPTQVTLPEGRMFCGDYLLILIAIGFLLSGTAGCSTPAPRGQASLLDFIKDGSTTKQEIRQRLGEPGASYVQDRVLTYRLSRDAGGYYALANKSDWTGVCSNLVLAFNDDGLLRRHSLVQISACS